MRAALLYATRQLPMHSLYNIQSLAHYTEYSQHELVCTIVCLYRLPLPACFGMPLLLSHTSPFWQRHACSPVSSDPWQLTEPPLVDERVTVNLYNLIRCGLRDVEHIACAGCIHIVLPSLPDEASSCRPMSMSMAARFYFGVFSVAIDRSACSNQRIGHSSERTTRHKTRIRTPAAASAT